MHITLKGCVSSAWPINVSYHLIVNTAVKKNGLLYIGMQCGFVYGKQEASK